MKQGDSIWVDKTRFQIKRPGQTTENGGETQDSLVPAAAMHI